MDDKLEYQTVVWPGRGTEQLWIQWHKNSKRFTLNLCSDNPLSDGASYEEHAAWLFRNELGLMDVQCGLKGRGAGASDIGGPSSRFVAEVKNKTGQKERIATLLTSVHKWTSEGKTLEAGWTRAFVSRVGFQDSTRPGECCLKYAEEQQLCLFTTDPTTHKLVPLNRWATELRDKGLRILLGMRSFLDACIESALSDKERVGFQLLHSLGCSNEGGSGDGDGGGVTAPTEVKNKRGRPPGPKSTKTLEKERVADDAGGATAAAVGPPTGAEGA